MNIDRYEFADIGPKKGFINVLRRVFPEKIFWNLDLNEVSPEKFFGTLA